MSEEGRNRSSIYIRAADRRNERRDTWRKSAGAKDTPRNEYTSGDDGRDTLPKTDHLITLAVAIREKNVEKRNAFSGSGLLADKIQEGSRRATSSCFLGNY